MGFTCVEARRQQSGVLLRGAWSISTAAGHLFSSPRCAARNLHGTTETLRTGRAHAPTYHAADGGGAPRWRFPGSTDASVRQQLRMGEGRKRFLPAGSGHFPATHCNPPLDYLGRVRNTSRAGVEDKGAPERPLGRAMGCALSGPGGVTPGPAVSEEKNCPSPEGDLDTEAESEGGGAVQAIAAFPLSEAQKELIQESWKVLHKDIARVGIIVFIRLFETHPECKDAFFLFRDIDDLQQLKMNKELQAHGLRVMSFIEKSVARLDQEDKLEKLAFELGKSHCRYKAPPKYYEYVGTQFIQAAQPILKQDWTLEVEKAWEGLFQYLAITMKRGFYEEEKSMRDNPAVDSQKAGVESTPNKI